MMISVVIDNLANVALGFVALLLAHFVCRAFDGGAKKVSTAFGAALGVAAVVLFCGVIGSAMRRLW